MTKQSLPETVSEFQAERVRLLGEYPMGLLPGFYKDKPCVHLVVLIPIEGEEEPGIIPIAKFYDKEDIKNLYGPDKQHLERILNG